LKKQMTEAAGPASGPASIATPGTKLISIAQIASDGGARQKGADPELVESIRINGLMQPIVVTDDGTGYRIIAGRRRLAALREVGVDAAPCVIVSATTPEDRKALELVENLHRLGLTAMQEAQGFQELAKRGLDAAAIGARVGRSVAYVYDRLRFTKLVPAAVRLLEDGRIEAGHAVILARLRPADQLRAISTKAVDAGYDDRHSPLWRMERTLFDHPGKMTRACSVRELDDWVRKHVRFNPEKDVDPVLLPGTAEILAMATKPREGQKKPPKVILITELQHLPDDARGDEREHAFRGPGHGSAGATRAWKAAASRSGAGISTPSSRSRYRRVRKRGWVSRSASARERNTSTCGASGSSPSEARVTA